MSLCGDRHRIKLGVISGFGLGGRDVADPFEDAAVVEPIDPFECGVFDRLERTPGSARVDDFGFEQADDRFG